MKYLFLSFLIIPVLTFSQDKEVDKLRAELNVMNNELTIVKESLDAHHEQYLLGAVISVIGSASTIVGSIMVAPGLIVGGGIASLIGAGIMIDSDKWFGKRYMDNSDGRKMESVDEEKELKILKRTNQLKELLGKGSISKQEYDDAIKELNKLKQ